MTYARHHLVAAGAAGTYHCVSRCVRRAFLCGHDAVSGHSFEHRKDWVEARLLQLAESFAVSIHAYAVMSNHLHVVVHIDPQAANEWVDEEVARRWLNAFGTGAPEAPALEQRVQALAQDVARVAVLRERLGSLSWFMSALVQPIARRANREDGVTGRFWEGRFKSQALLDERAVLACMAYVDLNPLRAGIARRLERCTHTSARSRIESGTPAGAPLRPVAGNPHTPLPGLSEAQYLDVLRWCWDGGEFEPTVLDALPAAARPLIGRPERWMRQVLATETHYARAIGSLEALLRRADDCRQRWLRGVGFARLLAKQQPASG